MANLIYEEPPEGAVGSVVWPSSPLPGYQITTIEGFDRSAHRKAPLNAQVNLEAVLASANASADLVGLPNVYVVLGD